jgi:hypothetical protein
MQKFLIKTLEELCPPNISLVDVLSDILGISKDSAYRRMRCETSFTLEELASITAHFKVSLDNIVSLNTDNVLFNYNSIRNIDEFKNYIHDITEDLRTLAKYKDIKIIYAAQDIPLFHNFRSELLSKFKLFYWLRSIVSSEEFQNKKFTEDLITKDLVEDSLELYNCYAKVPSDEIWTEITPVSLFKQVDFCWSSGLFTSKEQALRVCDEIEMEFKTVEHQASNGYKTDSKGNPMSMEKNFNLYWSEIEIGNNCILTSINNHKTVYLAYNTFNKITTTDQNYCNDIYNWLMTLIRKSTPISEVSEKHRYQFFKKLNKGLEEIRNKIMSED